ncbi:sensor histidine kinase [Mucilaginibacter sp.]
MFVKPAKVDIMIVKTSDLKPHIFFWAVFISYEVLVGAFFAGKFSNFWDDAGHYFLYIFLFYFNAHIVFPSALNDKRRNYFLLILFILGELLWYVLLKVGLYAIYHAFNIIIVPDDSQDHKLFIMRSIWRGIYFIFLSTGYWFALTTIHTRKKIADLEKLKLKSELDNQVLENAYLKAQINPHFLLNTLNFLYNSVSKLSDEIAESVLLLSDIMRYALTNADGDGKVSLELEVENIINFIKLNQARFNKRLQINMDINGDIEGLRIIPLVLITFTENIFKYGDLLNEIKPVKINVIINDNTLTFVTYNTKRKRVQHYGSNGIGIENVKKRLAMYYKYDLIIEDTETEYKSTLKVEL